MLEVLISIYHLLANALHPELFLAAGGFMFNLIALPTLLNPNAGIPRIQSVLSVAALLFCFTLPYIWMGFYWSAGANAIGAVVWTIIAIYRTPTPNPTHTTSQTQTVQPAD